MIEKQSSNISRMFKIIGGFLSILLIVFFIQLILDRNCCQCGDYTNTCCPCINEDYIDEVEEWAGYGPSGAGSWYDMCEEYKKENNKTFNCFVEK